MVNRISSYRFESISKFILLGFHRLLEKPPIFNGETETLLKNALKNAESESALQGVSRMEVEIKRGIKFLQISTDLRQYQRRAQVNLIFF
jgi:hypothetical protein